MRALFVELDDLTFQKLLARVESFNASLRKMTLEQQAEARRLELKVSSRAAKSYAISCGSERVTASELCSHYIHEALK